MIETWLEEAIRLAEDISERDYSMVLARADLSCERCGNCCVIPDLAFLNKPPNMKCRFLAEDNRCTLHGEGKPQPCQDFPYMENRDWVLGWRLAPPRAAIWFCGIVRKFWLSLYGYMKEKVK